MTQSNAWTRLVRYTNPAGETRLGQPVDPTLDIGLAVAAGRDDVQVYVIEGDVYDGVVTTTKDTIKTILSPLTREQCSIIRCLGLNFKAHAAEAKMPIPQEPIMFIKPRTALCGPGEILVDKVSQDQLDLETELAIVIGKDARNVSEADAMDYILGLTSSNDVSSRKLQLANGQWCHGKGLDDSCPIGPVLVRTGGAGQLDPDNLEFNGKLSGEVVQQSNTDDMIFSCRQALAYLSKGTTLERGSIIQMGTPSGIGWGKTPKRLILDGEDVRIWFEGAGTLVNTFKYE